MEQLPRSTCHLCRSFIQQHNKSIISRRTFTSSSLRPTIPPESPHFVDVPNSFQPDLVLPRQAKGILPVPRELFPARLRKEKPSEEYIRRATPDKKPHNTLPYEELSEFGKYKARMTVMRKQHLREGLTELHAREQGMRSISRQRSRDKQTHREQVLSQAEREDARLTNNSTPEAMKPGQTHLATAEDALALHAQKTANVAAKQARKEEERRDKLHTLYMNARQFITTETQLQEILDKVFAPPETHRMFNPATGGGKSMWDGGEPDKIATMIKKHQSSNDLRRGFGEDDRYKRDQERMKKIAEKLSGGKI